MRKRRRLGLGSKPSERYRDGEYNWWNIRYIALSLMVVYIEYRGPTPHMGTQCGTTPIYSNRNHT